MSSILLESNPLIAELEAMTPSPDWMVVIYNNDVTPFESVITILQVATRCTRQEAEIEAWEAHTFGKTTVHFASYEECTKAGEIISSIGVKVEVLPEWAEQTLDR